MFFIIWQAIFSLVWAGTLHLQAEKLELTHPHQVINVPWVKRLSPSELHPGKIILLHFLNPSASSFVKDQLKRQSAQILGYWPEDTWVVRLPERFEQLRAVTDSFKEQALFLQLLPLGKISRDFGVFHVFNAHDVVDARVVLWREQDAHRVREWIPASAWGAASGKYVDLRGLSRGELFRLAEREEVEWVEPAYLLQTWVWLPQDLPAVQRKFRHPLEVVEIANFPLTGYETGARLIGAPQVWSLGFRGQGESVFVVDTGLDRGEGRLSADFATATDRGFALGIGSSSWADPMGHGTHVAGSVLGRGELSSGEICGVAYEARLVLGGLWSPIMGNITVPTDLAQAFTPSREAGARVSNNSWGAAAGFGNYTTMSQQADEWSWQNWDYLVVFAAGNSGRDGDKDGKIDEGSVSPPSTAKNVLTVGASENLVKHGGIQKRVGELRGADTTWPAEPISSSYISDNPQGIAMFSSRGPTKDGRIKPEVVAPGTNILSAFSHEPGASVLWGAYNDHYVFSGGTSMAAPLVAGAAALVRQILKEEARYQGPIPSALVKGLLMLAADDLFPGQYGMGPQRELERRPDVHQGFGRVNLERVLDLVKRHSFWVGQVGEGESLEMTLSESVTEILLIYTDAPGRVSAGKALINDLDLELRGPTPISNPADRVNPFEYHRLGQATQGLSLKIVGHKVPLGHPSFGGKQPFVVIWR